MKPGKQLFYRFAVGFFLVSTGLAAACTLVRLWTAPYASVPVKLLLIVAAAAAALIMIFPARLLRHNTGCPEDETLRRDLTAEILPAGLMILTGTALRLLVIHYLPVQPESDFSDYYHIAEQLKLGMLSVSEENAWYCDRISTFPHILGYPAVLSLVFRVFGTSVYSAQLFNLLLQMLSCVLVWRTARLLGGRLSGLLALAAVTFLPSVILYSNILGSEALFTCVLMTGVYLFVHLMQSGGSPKPHMILYPAGLILLGLILAFASFIRPMGIIFLIAAVICIATIGRKKTESVEKPGRFLLHMSDRRWKQCLILTGFFFLFSAFFSSITARTIQREPAGASVSFGFNLMVGLNQQTSGAWNQKDETYRLDALKTLGTASAAQEACRDIAFERLKNTGGLPSLLAEKFIRMWGNDEYGAAWNVDFLRTQGQLTPEREAFLNRMTDISNLYYFFLLPGAFCCAQIMLRRKPDAGYALILTFCGTVALHLLVEQQNRYHYYALYLLAVLAGVGFHLLVRSFSVWITARREKV